MATDGGAPASGTADGNGILSVPLAVKGGNMVSLSNGARNLTMLHVAGLRADINGEQSVLAGGTCAPGQYYGPPLSDGADQRVGRRPECGRGRGGPHRRDLPAVGQRRRSAVEPDRPDRRAQRRHDRRRRFPIWRTPRRSTASSSSAASPPSPSPGSPGPTTRSPPTRAAGSRSP